MGRAHEVRAASMAKTAAQKSKVYNKHAKEIYMAAKSGVPDPDANLSLRAAIAKAKKDQVTADVIKRAIDKAKGGSGESYESVTYEGFGQGASVIIVECLTDNINRTYSSVRNIFGKTGSKLGVTGCVSHMFKNQACFSFTGLTDEEVLDLLVMADCDVEDVSMDEDGYVTVYAPKAEYAKVRQALLDAKTDISFDVDTTGWYPNDLVDLTPEEMGKFQRFLSLLDEDEDVQDVYHNVGNLPVEDEEE